MAKNWMVKPKFSKNNPCRILLYEIKKKELLDKNLPSYEHEKALKKIANEVGI